MRYIASPEQRRLTNMLVTKERFAAFFRMGVGKTAPTLTAINYLMCNAFTVRHALVVAPITVAYRTWPEEIAKWEHTRHLTYCVLHGQDREEEVLQAKKKDILITNYEGLEWVWHNQKKLPPIDLIVFDESSFLKNFKSRRSKIAKKLVKMVRYVFLLTGSPAPKDMECIWNQIYLIDGGVNLGRNVTTFRQRYMIPFDVKVTSSVTRTVYRDKPEALPDILEAIKDISLVAGDATVAGFPEVKTFVVDVKLPDSAIAVIKRMQKSKVLDGNPVRSMQEERQKLRQMASGFWYSRKTKRVVDLHDAKTNMLVKLLNSIDENFIIAVQFIEEMNVLSRILPEGSSAAITATTNQSVRKKIFDKWNAGGLKSLILHPASASHGLNLQDGGFNIVWFSPTDDTEHWEQLIARLARRGQKSPVVNNYVLLAEGIEIDKDIFSWTKAKGIKQETFLGRLREWK